MSTKLKITGVTKQIMRDEITRRPVGRHIARFILVGLYTGTRHRAITGAALSPAIGRGYVDLERGVFHRRAKGTAETKKRQPPVRLPERLLAHLRRWQRLGIAKHAGRGRSEGLRRDRGPRQVGAEGRPGGARRVLGVARRPPAGGGQVLPRDGLRHLPRARGPGRGGVPAARERALLVNAVRPDVIRLAPPLILAEADVDAALPRLSQALAAVERGQGDTLQKP